MSTQTDIFRRLVRDRLGDPPLLLKAQATLRDVVERMASETATCAVVVDDAGCPQGIVTEQDITRRVAFKLDPETPVSQVMSAPVVAIQEGDYLYHAVAFMRRRGLRHIPVLNAHGIVSGMLSLSEALGFLSQDTMELVESLTREDSLEGLSNVKDAQVELAQALLDDGVPVPEVQALLTDINHDIHRRILRRQLASMAKEPAWGEPPAPFSLIILGSGGRGENFLLPDQDNGFIIGDYSDSEHARIDAFFLELAQRMTLDLDAVGLPLCRGYVMATNPVWRKTLSQWADQIGYWMTSRSPATLRYCDIFFDFAHAFGEADLATRLRRVVTDAGRRNPGFLKDLFAIQKDHGVALGWFGRLRTETDPNGRPGMIDLKYQGTLPLVEAARLLALGRGVSATSTIDRLRDLRDKQAIDDNLCDYLTGGLKHITQLLLRQQLSDFRSGKPVTNFVPRDSLSKREKDYLADCFRAITDLRGHLETELSGDF